MMSANSIGHFAKMFEQQEFYLPHKSHLLNLNYIDKYLNGGCVVIGNENIPVSRSKRAPFLKMIKNT
ncbi:MAG: two-component system LytT family response regulator [Patiriisocius sp.]|jgi:two-component system LytT family response regulator